MSISVSRVDAAQSSHEDRFGRHVALRLTAGNLDLPHDVSERLRAARVQAVARRKLVPLQTPPVVSNSGGTALLGSWWRRVGALVPLVALVAGLITIHTTQQNNHAREEAEVDAALLTGDLPPSAFTDPGFTQFLKADRDAAVE